MPIESKNIFQRVSEALGIESVQAIADKFEITKQSVYSWQKGTVPKLEILAEIADSNQISLHWLLTGKGSKFFQERQNGSGTRRNGNDEDEYGERVSILLPPDFVPIIQKLADEHDQPLEDECVEIIADALADKGLIQNQLPPEQAMHFIPLGTQSNQWVEVKVLGWIAAGRPIQIFDPGDDYTILVPRVMVESSDVFALEVRGDSMIGEGVFDGDHVLISPGQSVSNGTTVAAEIDQEEATLKKYYRSGSQITLQPANPEYKSMTYPARRVNIRGVMVGILRGRKRR